MARRGERGVQERRRRTMESNVFVCCLSTSCKMFLFVLLICLSISLSLSLSFSLSLSLSFWLFSLAEREMWREHHDDVVHRLSYSSASCFNTFSSFFFFFFCLHFSSCLVCCLSTSCKMFLFVLLISLSISLSLSVCVCYFFLVSYSTRSPPSTSSSRSFVVNMPLL